jgi:hypothetical protein
LSNLQSYIAFISVLGRGMAQPSFGSAKLHLSCAA